MARRDQGEPEDSDAPASSGTSAPEELGSSGASGHVVVAIGGSAGGFEALQQLLEKLPAESGLTFLVVLHADPHAKSYAAELLDRSTAMAVTEAIDGESLQPNHVYLAPPGSELAIESGIVRARSIEGSRGHSIDSFLRSVSEDLGDHLICVILSGTGNDGSLGIRAVKEHGGISFVQSPESAKFDGMPRSAIATGLVDHVLPLTEIPQRLVEYAADVGARTAARLARGSGNESEQVDAILGILHRQSQHDFSRYKRSMILRRIERRMLLNRLDTPDRYVEFLRTEPGEVDALFRDLLIGVTQFFRDRPAFECLASQVITPLLAAEETERPVRIWCPGCATGEEAYSIAILVSEEQERRGTKRSVQIFATDLDERSLETARQGIYPSTIEDDVSPQRLRSFFVQENGGYRVSKRIRELAIFPRHNLIHDPPFSKLDLVSCRNVLIYLTPGIQKRVLSLFHYALNREGYLFLGPSENVTGLEALFEAIDKKAKLFVAKTSLDPTEVDLEIFPGPITRFEVPGRLEVSRRRDLAVRLANNALLATYAPPAVTVDRHHRIVEFHGRTGRYLEPAVGAPDTDVMKMARGGLRPRLSAALREAERSKRTVVSRAATGSPDDGSVDLLDLVVQPLPEDEITGGCYLIVFEEPGVDREPSGDMRIVDAEDERHSTALEEELARTKDHLRATVESLEASNEELRSSNEEMLSMNEELQSANEELETSREELQSINEELQTVNSELMMRLEELAQVNSDMSNLLASTRIATIFLDRQLTIKNFTPAVGDIFNLLPGDVGRPLADLAHDIDCDDLTERMQAVLQTLAPYDCEVETRDGTVYQMRILPYRSVDDVIEGVVTTFIDITEVRRAEQRAQQARAYAESLVEAISSPLAILDTELEIVSVNPAFQDTFDLEAEDVVGTHLANLEGGVWGDPDLLSALRKAASEGTPLKNFALEARLPQLGRRYFVVSARRIEPARSGDQLILLALTDTTARIRAEEATGRSQRLESLGLLAGGLAHDFNNLLQAIGGNAELARRSLDVESSARTHLEAIDSATGRAAKLVEQMLDYAGQQHLELRLIDLGDVIEAVENLLRSSIPAQVHLSFRLAANLPPVRADPAQIEQVCMNLLLNAAEAMPDEGGEVVVSTGTVEADEELLRSTYLSAELPAGTYVFLEIADRGVGMDEETRAKMFDPFFSTKFTGRGLGLAAVLGIVHRHSGTLLVDSAREEGTRIRVLLPRTSDAPEAQPTDSPPDDVGSPAPLGSTTVLVVDDDEAIRTTACKLMENAGLRTVAVTSGAEAEAVLEDPDAVIDVVLLDFTMPDQDGIETLRRLRRIRPEVKVILTSGYGEERIQERLHDLRADGFLAKPYDLAGLIETVTGAIRS